MEDDKGRSSLFILCEQMAHISSETCPDSNRLMQVVLEATHGTLGGSDRSGRTVLDIEEKVTHSCLSACRHLLNSGAAGSSGNSSHHHLSNSSRPSSRGAVSASKDWELERPRSNSNVSLTSSSLNRPPLTSSTNSFKYTGSVDPPRRTLVPPNGHSAQSHLADSFSVSRNGISHFQDSSMLHNQNDLSLSTPLDPVKKKLSASYLEVDDDVDERVKPSASRYELGSSLTGRSSSSGTNGHSRNVPATYLSRK